MPKRKDINTLSVMKSTNSMPQKHKGKGIGRIVSKKNEGKEAKSQKTLKQKKYTSSKRRRTIVRQAPIIRVPAIAVKQKKEKTKKEKTKRVKTCSNPENKLPRTQKKRRQRVFDIEPYSTSSSTSSVRRRKERLIKRQSFQHSH